jgi:hypothetical protein
MVRFDAWLREYYPTEAQDVAPKDALEHSIQKWRGLLPSALKRYGLCLDYTNGCIDLGGTFESRHVLWIDDATCALCVHYCRQRPGDPSIDCAACPLAQYLGYSCDEHSNAPYEIFRRTGNVRPMLAALRATRRARR